MFIEAYNSKETSNEFKTLVASMERIYDKQWNSFYEGLREKSKSAMMYNYFFIIRKFLFVISVYYWYDFVGI